MSSVAVLQAYQAARSRTEIDDGLSRLAVQLQRPLRAQQHQQLVQQASPAAAWVHAVVKATAQHLDGESADAELRQRLTDFGSRALEAADNGRAADVQLLRYQFIRKLVGCGQYQVALQQGWKLQASVANAASISTADQPQQDLLISSVLNLVVCMGELGSGSEGATHTRQAARTACGASQLDDLSHALVQLESTLR